MKGCRFCKSKKTINILDLGKIPLSNNFIKQNELIHTKKYNLEIFICSKCLLVQTRDVVNKNKIFNKDYLYYSSFSKSWLKHSKNLALDLIKEFNLNKSTQVLEIASNDGYLLNFFKKEKIPCAGIEPSASVAKIAKKKKIKTYINFFNKKFADKLIKKNIIPKIIIALNVLAHTPNLTDFVRGIKVLIQKKGICVIEFPHLLNLIKKFQFDTIYHEHFSYLSCNSVDYLATKFGLKLFKLDQLETHGGSNRYWLTRQSLDRSKNLLQELAREKLLGLFDENSWREAEYRKQNTLVEFKTWLIDCKKRGETVFGYGAAAKASTLLNAAKVDTDLLPKICDLSAEKVGRFMPAEDFEIISFSDFIDCKPDNVIVFPWNILEEISKQIIGNWPDIKIWIAIPSLQRIH